MFKALAATAAVLVCLTGPQVPAEAKPSGRANSVSNIDTVRLVEDTWYGRKDKTLNINRVSVGDTINGLKINYIGCIYQTKTMRGWGGGPKYISRQGTYNCFAGAVKHKIGPGASGPQLIMSVVKTVR